MKNLARYNSKWISMNNNFLSNTFNSTLKNIKKDIKKWKKKHLWDTIPVEETSIKNFSKKTSDESISLKIKTDITKMYENEIPFAIIWDIGTEKLRAKIITSHLNIQDSIKILNDTCSTSVKVCKSQGGWWYCWNCN
jgi:phosphoribosyl-dephospho-CoA transferase